MKLRKFNFKNLVVSKKSRTFAKDLKTDSNMKKIRVDWDADNEDVTLPYEVEVPEIIDEEDIADWLSDNYGWCVNSFYEV